MVGKPSTINGQSRSSYRLSRRATRSRARNRYNCEHGSGIHTSRRPCQSRNGCGLLCCSEQDRARSEKSVSTATESDQLSLITSHQDPTRRLAQRGFRQLWRPVAARRTSSPTYRTSTRICTVRPTVPLTATIRCCATLRGEAVRGLQQPERRPNALRTAGESEQSTHRRYPPRPKFGVRRCLPQQRHI
jgi:hypothetical protein